MRCDELKSVLELDDADAVLDAGAAREHLAGCARCAGRWPEVGMLLEAAHVPGARAGFTRRGAARAVAAGLVAVAIAGVALQQGSRRDDGRGSPAAAREPDARAPAVRPPGSSTVSRRTVIFERGERYESRFTYEVWTAPTPSCLERGGSGS
jgi:hypothetical protein